MGRLTAAFLWLVLASPLAAEAVKLDAEVAYEQSQAAIGGLTGDHVLTDHRGQGFSFYHEIYQCKTAEAIFEVGSLPVGPATFCETSAVTGGEGRSQERQRRFADAAGSA